MYKLSRRQFFGKSFLGLGTALLADHLHYDDYPVMLSAKNKLPAGFQIWTVRDMLLKDFAGTLKTIANMGYESVEMCSPPGYGFTPLMKMSAKEMKSIVNDSGLSLTSTHYNFNEFRKNLDERIEFAAQSGQKQMILSSFGLPKGAAMDDWKKAAEELNKYGEKSKSAGIQMGYHNHHGEFEKIDGVLIYDSLMQAFDPELVKMQFQVAVISIGYKAVDYFKKYPGRFISAHLADWSPAENKNVALGRGIVDWKEFFKTLKTGGVKNIFVEMDFETFSESVKFLHKI